MKHEVKLLGYYNYTVVLTYIGMLIGFLGIVTAFEGYSFTAICCLLVSGFCDMFDGAIASTNKKRTEPEKCFGIQIDSFSDLICFCVLPASLVYSLSNRSAMVLVICSVYVLCGLIRLAYFNVDEQQRQISDSSPRELYLGMPVTLSALFIPMIYGIASMVSLKSDMALTISLIVMGILFLIPIPLRKPHAIGKACAVACGIAEVWILSNAALYV